MGQGFVKRAGFAVALMLQGMARAVAGVDVTGHADQLLVVPADWIPRGYLRPSDPQDANPFRFRSAADFHARLARYVDLLDERAGEGAGAYRDLPESKRAALDRLIDAREGEHRLVPWPPGDRVRALGEVLDVAFTGGREAERERAGEFHPRVLVIVEPDAGGTEVDAELVAEADRLSRPGSLVPCVDVLFFPYSKLEALADGFGIRSLASSLPVAWDRTPRLAGPPTRFDRLVAERFLEQRLLEKLLASVGEERAQRCPFRDRFGVVQIAGERTRYALRDHDSAKKLRPLPNGVQDLYWFRRPLLLGQPDPEPDPAWRVRVEREAGDAASRTYVVAIEVEPGYSGPIVGRVAERLDAPSTVTRIDHRAPGSEDWTSIEALRCGARFVPEPIGQRLDDSGREPRVSLEPVPPGEHRFRVRVIGREH